MPSSREIGEVLGVIASSKYGNLRQFAIVLASERPDIRSTFERAQRLLKELTSGDFGKNDQRLNDLVAMLHFLGVRRGDNIVSMLEEYKPGLVYAPETSQRTVTEEYRIQVK